MRTAPLTLLLLATVAHAADPPARDVWNARTAPPPAASTPATTAVMPLRVYEGLGAVGPLYGRADDTAFAIDVVAEYGTCTDGSRIVTALTIGGTRYPLPQRCRDASQAGPSTGNAPLPGGAAAARCDARRWTCRSQP